MKLGIWQMLAIGSMVVMFAGLGLGTQGIPLIGLGGLVLMGIVLWKTRDYKMRRYRKVLQSRHENFGELWRYRDEEADRKRFGV
jgi:hypothetical protein